MGILAAVLSAIFSSSKDIVSKKLAADVDGTVSAFASFLFALPYYCILLSVLSLLGMESFVVSQYILVLVVARALTDTAAEWCKMQAFSHADISLVASIFALYPLFLLFTSPLITGDELPLIGFLATLLIVSGSLVLVFKSTRSAGAKQQRGAMFALGSAFCFSLNSCFDRLAVQKASPAFSGFAMTLLSALFLLPAFLRKRNGVSDLKVHSSGFLVRGLFEVAFMVVKLSALQYLQAPVVVGIQSISTILSIVSGRVVFKEQDFKRRLLAGCLILVGICIFLAIALN